MAQTLAQEGVIGTRQLSHIYCTLLCEAPLLYHEHNLANLCVRGQVGLGCQGLRQWKDTVDKRPQPSIGEGRQEIGVRCKCDRWFYQYIGFDVPAPVYAWCCLY